MSLFGFLTKGDGVINRIIFFLLPLLSYLFLYLRLVDVLAEQMGKENVLMIICECKLKFSNSLITEAEIEEFREKVEKEVKHISV